MLLSAGLEGGRQRGTEPRGVAIGRVPARFEIFRGSTGAVGATTCRSRLPRAGRDDSALHCKGFR